MSSLIERLRKIKDNRGMMADLRCFLTPSQRHRAWPALYRVGIPITEEVSAFVAGLYAAHPDGDSLTIGNFGETCKCIEKSKDRDSHQEHQSSTSSGRTPLTPTERRFQHLLAADRSEIQDRVRRMTFLAKSLGTPVNYEALHKDLRFWGERTKTQWAATYWSVEVKQEGGDQ
ncbi:type I-E CRISPR-associated protein Cse2/CasB [Desulforhopalus singaporensis]|uniref:CRISPR system Cascade subunit CasB n=1 Tax=Desulforhopalus singaporensis TaxID=91360 RepID=A0A1H0TVS2_9BACT|nr:type I-E CRISPR-associated protein Cse2/CasB [Desulforhopalus singaporensis]SDP57758.1 CRISPR system Cascade subunit CasB [Desulforhopalus singaporensis]